MKHIIYLFFIAFVLIACGSADKTNSATSESAEEGSAEASKKVNAKLQEINTDEALVATALMAAPEASRAGCKVIGYNMAGEFVTLKEGNNEFICLADDPKKSGFSAACYHKELDEFMARGRALKAEGKSATEIFDIREEEVKAGKLSMGTSGNTLHIYFGGETNYDPESGLVEGAKYRYVVYMPWATAESTGLPERPVAPNHPWIMNPGTHRAHIMISPINEAD